MLPAQQSESKETERDRTAFCPGSVAIRLSGQRPVRFRTLPSPASDVFGPTRCMFASNFPVDRLHAGDGALWRAYAAIVAGAGEDERDALFAGTAMRVYRL